jgi:hypothetical protein
MSTGVHADPLLAELRFQSLLQIRQAHGNDLEHAKRPGRLRLPVNLVQRQGGYVSLHLGDEVSRDPALARSATNPGSQVFGLQAFAPSGGRLCPGLHQPARLIGSL